jgi:hypothetical protein
MQPLPTAKMPAGYRTALISIGVFLALGGLIGLIGGITAKATAPQHVNSIVGGVFALVSGWVIVRSAITGRVPRWVKKLFGLKAEED